MEVGTDDEKPKGLDTLPLEIFDKIMAYLYYDDAMTVRQSNRDLKKYTICFWRNSIFMNMQFCSFSYVDNSSYALYNFSLEFVCSDEFKEVRFPLVTYALIFLYGTVFRLENYSSNTLCCYNIVAKRRVGSVAVVAPVVAKTTREDSCVFKRRDTPGFYQVARSLELLIQFYLVFFFFYTT